ncbi:folylpolyglutamate synthase [Peptococcaceae bacterium CEB3]|nr:folylpolyglutamate synthase [Peptococcaceae bacterium CEB3]
MEEVPKWMSAEGYGEAEPKGMSPAKYGRVSEEEYEEALAYLVGLTKFGMNFGLDRIRELLRRLGNPEQSLRIIHVGGTNGKGSTTLMTAEILRAAGYKVGMFTSPHLHDYRERMVINGEMVPKAAVVRLMERLKPHLEKMVAQGLEHPTEFEVNTAMCLLYFAEEEVDFALLEVGLGGEIDSTNVVSPLISVVTNVGMDHMDYLGPDIPTIARNKAGIIKPHSVVITAAKRPEVLAILREKAREAGDSFWRVGEDVRWESRWSGETEQEFDLFGLHGAYPKLRLTLIGAHQLENAATAVTICEVLQSAYGVAVPRPAIYAGLKRAKWPGRLELLSVTPKVLLDGAHNYDGARVLAQSLPLYQRRRLVFVLGMLADKERERVVDLLAPLADEIIVTKPNSPRAGDWQALAGIAAKYGRPVSLVEDPEEAVALGLQHLGPEDMLCVTGSLYMLAAARPALLQRLGRLTR